MTACYLDASALVKLVADETETTALRENLAAYAARVTSRVTWVEVARAVSRKADAPRRTAEAATAALEGVVLIELDEAIARVAAELAPATLRTLDAIHLASALAIRDELDALISYDARLAEAAQSAGLNVLAPS